MFEAPWMPNRRVRGWPLPGLLDAFLGPDQTGVGTPDGAYVVTAGQRADPRRAPEDRPPVLSREADRRRSILQDTPAKIRVAPNADADGSAPWYASDPEGIVSIARHQQWIDEEARRTGVDPDLVRAIMYVENAQGGA